MDNILLKSATEQAKLIKDKKISSEELTKLYLHQIEKVNPDINAMVQIKPDEVIKNARIADDELSKGRLKGSLHGLPITIKDAIKIKNYKCTTGTLGLKDNIPNSTGTCVKRITDAGGIILGLTNMPEVGGAFETDNLIYGCTNNPYDLTKTPGGSSGGEAAILASGGSSLGLGADGGGSIRVPSHFCGIAGIKPTTGRIPLTGLLIPENGVGLCNTIGTFGPMARYAEDLELMLKVLSGPDGFDPHVPPVTLQSTKSVEINKLKVAFFSCNNIIKVDPEIQNNVKKCALELQKAGATVEEISMTNVERTYELLWGGMFEGGHSGGEGLEKYLKSIGSYELSDLQKTFIESAKSNRLDIYDYQSILTELDLYRFNIQKLMQNYDIILCPPCASLAKNHKTSFKEIKDFTYTMMFNITKQPSSVVRTGTSCSNLPIGIQIVARLWEDHVSIAVAKYLENKFDGWQPPTKYK